MRSLSPISVKRNNGEKALESASRRYGLMLPSLLLIASQVAGRFASRFTRSELAASTALKCLLVGADANLSAFGKYPLDLIVRTRYHVNADEFTDAASRGSSGVSRSFYGSDITANKNGHIAGTDVFFADELHVGCLNHCVSGFDAADKSLGLDHSERL
jgi:hypothetical protein